MSTHDDALPWLAERYVLGELTAADAAAFEARLADDEQAGAAVADAARLLTAIAATNPHGAAGPVGTVAWPAGRTQPPRRAWRGRITIGLAGLAASVAVGGFLARMTKDAAAGRTGDLAERWAEIAAVSAPEEPVDDEDVAAGDDVPDWLLAAVTLEQARTIQEN